MTNRSLRYAEGITTNVVVSKTKLRRALFGVLGLVVTAGVVIELLRPILRLGRRGGFVPLLSMSHEGNVPTLYTAALLFVDAMLVALVAVGTKKRGGPFVAYWWLLAAGFLYIALDEVLMLHEAWGALLRLAPSGWARPSGLLHFHWVIPATVIVIVVGLAFLPFLRALPAQTRKSFMIAGAIYVGGAVGMELPLGLWTERVGSFDLGYALIDAVEESMEMLGLNLFLLAAVDYIAGAGFALQFSRGDTRESGDDAGRAELTGGQSA